MADFLPQLIEFASQLDLQRLIVIQTTFSMFGAIRNVPVYNIPLLFFGLYAYNHHDSIEPLQQFAGFTAFSILLDIVWCLLQSFGLGTALTICVLVFKPLTIISALHLLKYRGDPFSSLGMNISWSNQRFERGYGGGGGGGYQTLTDAMEDERDAQEVHIPRHHGRMRHSQQSGSFMTNSSRSTSLKSSSRAGSGHNVELGSSVNSNGINIPSAGVGQYGVSGHTGPTSPISTHSAAAHLPAPAPAPAPGLPPPPAHTPNKDDRRDRVGQNVSEDEDDLSSHEGSAKAGHQPF